MPTIEELPNNAQRRESSKYVDQLLMDPQHRLGVGVPNATCVRSTRVVAPSVMLSDATSINLVRRKDRHEPDVSSGFCIPQQQATSNKHYEASERFSSSSPTSKWHCCYLLHEPRGSWDLTAGGLIQSKRYGKGRPDLALNPHIDLSYQSPTDQPLFPIKPTSQLPLRLDQLPLQHSVPHQVLTILRPHPRQPDPLHRLPLQLLLLRLIRPRILHLLSIAFP